MEKVLIITKQNEFNNYIIEELKNLCFSCNLEVIDIIIPKLDIINSKYYVGTGKIEEIKNYIALYNIDIALFNTELTPSQFKNIEDYLNIKIIDRSMLILEIFRTRAKTKQAMLEVELAQLKYYLPRLSGMKSFTRQGGSSGSFSSKGPGEKKLELDKRKINNNINNIKLQLEIIKNRRKQERKKRIQNEIPIVAFVGYTNSGKSTTLNTLLKLTNNQNSKKEVLSKNLLFSTIDTTARRIKLPDNQEIILVDTVGFVSDLPKHLVSSFKSTLENIIDADLIIHVVDATNNFKDKQILTTNKILEEINVNCKDIVYLYNKADLLDDSFYIEYTPGFLFSNKANINHNYLIDFLTKKLSKNTIYKELFIPYGKEKIINILKEESNIKDISYTDLGTNIKCYLSNKTSNRINTLLI